MMLWRDPESDLRRRRFDGDAVPADAAAAHLVRVVTSDEGVGGLARHVPREARDKYRRHDDCGEDDDVAAAEALARRQPVHLHRRDH